MIRHFARVARAIATSAALMLAVSSTPVTAQTNPGPVKAEETAIILIDFQANFTSPDGAWYTRFKDYYDKTKMLDRTVDLVKQARAKAYHRSPVLEWRAIVRRQGLAAALDWSKRARNSVFFTGVDHIG